MALYIPQNGANVLLDILAHWLTGSVSLLSDEICQIRLYQNDYTPVWSTTDLDFTEADFDGYAPIDLPSYTLSPPGEPFERATFPDAVWTLGSGSPSSNDIYGYYVTSPTFGILWAEKREAGSITIDVVGQTITITPRFDFGNCVCP